jgi:hypothetical protein
MAYRFDYNGLGGNTQPYSCSRAGWAQTEKGGDSEYPWIKQLAFIDCQMFKELNLSKLKGSLS